MKYPDFTAFEAISCPTIQDSLILLRWSLSFENDQSVYQIEQALFALGWSTLL